ncbi:hypothetical protein CKM354_001191200 [Cercospora kikuchii]|uniref:RTA1-domain-containing protein n=1 Tax=Cercospora kikuchii TaxID=84275 RepID=A0A9P3D0W2_9PEZI|nr:uncharacterized protein CKM354_001191200 [Cercospora kikuchii]GIZ48868.1 hypothetical protein CKM354_001191200 [Cercospora kikuchii]
MAPLINNILHHILARQATEPSSEENDAFADFEFYHYSPSLAAAIIFTLLFIATTALHTYQLIRTRTLYMIPFLIGGFFQSIGYIARAVSATQKNGEWTLGPYIVQSTLILVAPALFAASVYMHLGRVVRMVNGGQTDEKLLFGLIKTTWLTKVFVAGDVISFMMQAGGGGLMATENVDTGETLVLGGLGVQIAFFGLFVFTGVTWNLKMRSRNSTESLRGLPWQKHMISLYIVSILIFVRSIVRMVEYAQGFSGYILSREWYLYVFDALLMWLAMVTLNVIHPSAVAAQIRGTGKMVTHVIQTKDVQ